MDFQNYFNVLFFLHQSHLFFPLQSSLSWSSQIHFLCFFLPFFFLIVNGLRNFTFSLFFQQVNLSSFSRFNVKFILFTIKSTRTSLTFLLFPTLKLSTSTPLTYFISNLFRQSNKAILKALRNFSSSLVLYNISRKL